MAEADHVKVENIFKGGHGDGGLAALAPAAVAAMSGHSGLGGGTALAAGAAGLVLGRVLNGNNGWLGNGGDGSGSAVNQLTLDMLQGEIGDIKAAVPQTALQIENAILSQTNELAGQINGQTNILVSGLSNVKDTVVAQGATNLAATNQVNQNVLLSKSDVLQAISNSTTAIISKIDANTIANLQAELSEARHTGRSREVEVNVTQNVNQQQTQLQTQTQIQALLAGVNTLIGNHQNLQQGIINLGTMTGHAGQQTAAQTRVN